MRSTPTLNRPVLWGAKRYRVGPPDAPSLLSHLNLARDHAYVVDSRSLHDIDRAGHLCERHLIVTFYEGDLLGTLFENIREARAKRIPVTLVFVNQELSALHELHHDRVRVGLRAF